MEIIIGVGVMAIFLSLCGIGHELNEIKEVLKHMSRGEKQW